MSHGIEKSTYVNADEKTRSSLTFDLLNKIYQKAEELKICHDKHLDICNERFKGIEGNKKKDTAKSSLFGFLGGFVAMFGYYIKNIFSN